MALDRLARSFHAARLDNIGIERALYQPVQSAVGASGLFCDAGRFVVKYGDEFRANDFSFCLRVGHRGEFCEEPLRRIDGNEIEPQLVAQILLDIDEFVFAQNTVVDEDAGELAADGLVHQDRGYRGVDAAREPADHVARADLFANRRNGGLDKVCWSPVAASAADGKDKILEKILPQGCVVDLGMKLHGPDAALRILDSCQRIGSGSRAVKAGGQFESFVSMTHPYVHGLGQACK